MFCSRTDGGFRLLPGGLVCQLVCDDSSIRMEAFS